VAHVNRQTLLITDGGLPALVAAAIEAERAASADGNGGGGGHRLEAGATGGGKSGGKSGGGGALLMPWVTDPTLADAQLAAVSSQARFLRHELLEPAPIREFAAGTSPAFLDSLGLLVAVEVARANGCGRIIWPTHTHSTDDTLASEIEGIAASVDRALLVERLAMLDVTTPGESAGADDITIETPLVDLTDAQLADLVVDLDAPAYLCWWWRSVPGEAAERIAEGERAAWKRALHGAGWVSASPGVQINAPAPTASAPGPSDRIDRSPMG